MPKWKQNDLRHGSEVHGYYQELFGGSESIFYIVSYFNALILNTFENIFLRAPGWLIGLSI